MRSRVAGVGGLDELDGRGGADGRSHDASSSSASCRSVALRRLPESTPVSGPSTPPGRRPASRSRRGSVPAATSATVTFSSTLRNDARTAIHTSGSALGRRRRTSVTRAGCRAPRRAGPSMARMTSASVMSLRGPGEPRPAVGAPVGGDDPGAPEIGEDVVEEVAGDAPGASAMRSAFTNPPSAAASSSTARTA